MAVVVKRDDAESPWDISTYETTKDETTEGMSGKTMWEIAREVVVKTEILIRVIVDLRDGLDALDRNAIALIESHNELAKERAAWRNDGRQQKDAISKLQLELARAQNRQVRETGLGSPTGGRPSATRSSSASFPL
ncbi:hypothetical protein E4U40_003315, partial [Claviceps sp. LM458 group G5]